MRKTENGFTGNEQHSAMARLSLDDMIDQLLHSNALSLKLTANPATGGQSLVPDRKYLY